MTGEPTPLLLAVFRERGHAGRVLAQLRDDHAAGPSGIIDAAALTWDGSGRCGIVDSWSRDARGLEVGGVVGAFIASLAGPVMATAAGNTVLGGLRGRLESAPLKFELLAIGHELPPGASLLVAMAAPGSADHPARQWCTGASLLLTYDLRASVVERLNDGGDVAFPFPPRAASRIGTGPLDGVAGAGDLADPLPGDGAIIVSAAILSDQVPSGHGPAIRPTG